MTRALQFLAAAVLTAVLLVLSGQGQANNRQVVKVIRSVFGPRHDDTAICIAKAESHLYRFAVSSTDDHGIFQIHRGLETYGRRIYGVWFNTRVAHRMSRSGTNFYPWTGTYGRGLCRGLS